jgi:hypothetical protein
MTLRLWKRSVDSATGQAVAHGERQRAAYLSLVPAAAAALVAFAWMPALGAPYQFDDYNTPVGDAASQSLANWWQMLPRTLRPLTKLTFALESSLGADSAPARRVLSVLLLLGCVVLFKSLLERVARLPAALALLVASIWAVHPAQAETVIALAGRPVLLSLFLTLASALLLARARPGLALGCALLALLARESALPWLVACGALAAHQQGISGRRIAGASVAAFGVGALVLASSSGVRALLESAQSSGGAWNRLGLQWAALTRGTFLLFANPAAFTPDMEFGPTGIARLGLILTTLALYVTAAWVALTQPRLRLFALLWLCIVLPTHSIVPKLDVLTARPFSASLAPLLALVACGIGARLDRSPRLEARATLVLAGAFLLLFPLTRSKAGLYRDPIALWRDAADSTTHKTRPLVNLGTLLARQGELSEAESVLSRALERDPTSVDIRLRLSKVRRALRLLRLPATEGNP